MTAAVIVSLTVLSYAIGWLIGKPVLMPLFNTLASFPFMVMALKRGDLRPAVARMLLWALTLGLCATCLSYARPSRTDELFLRAGAYRAEMFAWVMSGRGAESTPSVFIPQQIADASIFALLAAASGGILAMPLGAVLMNEMGHYVGSLAAASARPALTAVLGWHPWAVIRVMSFVVMGVVLSAPVLARAGRFTVDWRAARVLLQWAAAGLVLDVVMKWLLAPFWQRLLLHVVGW